MPIWKKKGSLADCSNFRPIRLLSHSMKIFERIVDGRIRDIYRAVVRPVAMYGAECWPATKEVETRLSVMGTKMLRWAAGVTRMDRIRNDAIRQKFGVAPIADKMGEACLRWYGHVLRGKEDSVRKIDLKFEVKAAKAAKDEIKQVEDQLPNLVGTPQRAPHVQPKW
ncbi:unnamed protein product [Heligmosomoides polygyrus]|uniref:Reverse transcriptase domain-containing protein n=1 Tax=Heligmosomoides polygyrus TaxID=6339 RepID=A0A183GF82_HELPZ|nr:unnamed protein product [Heligmosomoides polygyrus]